MSVTRWHELAQDWLAWAPRLQVVLYEDLVLDPVRETERMMAFLRLAPDPRRLSCLAAAEHVGGAFHRAGGLEVSASKCSIRRFVITENAPTRP